MKIRIRKSVPADIPWAKKHLTEMWVTHARNEPNLLNEKLMKSIFSEKKYKAQLRDKKIHALIAEVDGQIAGYLKTDTVKIPKFFKNNKILYIDIIYVAKKFRRMGVAKRLLLEAEKIAKREGIKRLQGRVYTFNKPSQKLLESAGWHTPHATYDKLLK